MSQDVTGKILKMLRNRERFYSGAEMSKALGISRSAVWKHIKSLRREGYHIESKSARGYWLVAVPEHPAAREIQEGLKTAKLGRRIHFLHEVSSTNEVAFRLALNGAEEGEVVLAESQTKGKGRLGRLWVSPAGFNIYLSIILRPRIVPSKTPLITLMTAVACAEAVHEIADFFPQIKWPNDLLIGGKKLGGILTEADMELDRINFIIVGIGINVNMPADFFPISIRDTATSILEACERKISRVALTQAILRLLEKWYRTLGEGRGEKIRSRWQELSLLRGKNIEVTFMGEVLKGTAGEIDEDGALLIQINNGTIKRVVAGDVTLTGR